MTISATQQANRERSLRHYYANKEVYIERMRKHKEENKFVHTRCSLKHRAQKLGVDFNLSVEEMKALVPNYCIITGLKLSYTEGTMRNTPSFDRIDNEKGYTTDNVWVISMSANASKGKKTMEEFLAYRLDKGHSHLFCPITGVQSARI